MLSTMYQKAQFCRNLRKQNSTVTCGLSPTKILFSDYLKSFISRINEISLKRYFIEKQQHIVHL